MMTADKRNTLNVASMKRANGFLFNQDQSCLNYDFYDFRMNVIWCYARMKDRLINQGHQLITPITVKTNSPVKL